MINIQVIDAGSNGIRMAVARADSAEKVIAVKTFREGIRLGQDVFHGGRILESTIAALIAAFKKFKIIGAQNRCHVVRAVGTSAFRDASNGRAVLQRIYRETGIRLEIIGADEEARLIYSAVSRAINLKGKYSLLVDIGGGSVELTLAGDGKILETQSLKLGAVRLLRMLGAAGEGGQSNYHRLVSEFVATGERNLAGMLHGKNVKLCVGTGGNIEALAALREPLLKKKGAGFVTVAEMGAIGRKLQALSLSDRISRLGLRPDRADVIIPAAIVLHTLLKKLKIDRVSAPGVGLKEGLIYDAAAEFYQKQKEMNREQALQWAEQLGRKYYYDEKHARAVARHAVKLFDKTRSLHKLAEEHKLILEAAALLHDIGVYVNLSAHHKHTYYLLNAEPIAWLSNRQKAILTNVTRYHRKAFPTIGHEPFKAMSEQDRATVTRLAAILRLANALDAERGLKVKSFRIERKGSKVLIYMTGKGDMLLEKWALKEKGALFESVFGVGIVVGNKKAE